MYSMSFSIKLVKYDYIRGKLIRIVTSDESIFANILGYCTYKPLHNSVMRGSGCVLSDSVGVTMEKINLLENPSLSITGSDMVITYPTMHIPLHNINHIYVIEKDKLSKLMLLWISCKKQLPIDITKLIDKFIEGWRVETPVKLVTQNDV